VIPVGQGRVLGYAEFGDPGGRLVLWHHGTPGARRQLPIVGRRAAERLGLRVVLVERPGVGDSTNHRYGSFREWADDAAVVVDDLGHDRFASVGLSGGGPYALACAAALGDRVTAVGLLGSVCPLLGPDAAPPEGVLTLAARFRGPIGVFRTVLGTGLWAALQPLGPLAHPMYRLYASQMPEGDQKVFANPEIEAMFVDDLITASRRQFGAIVHDVALFGQPWGFDLAEIEAPVFWWHGDADNIVPLAHAEHAVGLLKGCELAVRPTESHLGAFAAADLVLEAIDGVWSAPA
jgi:pimeloyl-ACP methyl ester carboxylesterase